MIEGKGSLLILLGDGKGSFTYLIPTDASRLTSSITGTLKLGGYERMDNVEPLPRPYTNSQG